MRSKGIVWMILFLTELESVPTIKKFGISNTVTYCGLKAITNEFRSHYLTQTDSAKASLNTKDILDGLRY